MFKYKNHLSFYELINLINYAVELDFSAFLYNGVSHEKFKLSTCDNIDNLTPIIDSVKVRDRVHPYISSQTLSIFRNNFLKTKNNTLDTKIETLKDFLNVDSNIIKIPSYPFNDNVKVVLYDKYNYDKFLYYKYTRHENDYSSSNFQYTYMNNHIENFKTTCEIGNLNYNYIILLNNLLYKLCNWDYSTNILETDDYMTNETIHNNLKLSYRNYLSENELFIRNITNINLPVDFINEATQIIIQNSKKLDILLNDIIAYLTSTSELFNAFIDETQTITETIIQDEDVTATQTHTKQAKTITKEITDDDETTANENNKSADYIINSTTDINNIDDLYSNKYSDKATQNKNTFTSSKNKTYNETLNDSGDNVENQDVTARDSETTKQHMSTFSKYKGIDIDIKTYQEIIKEIINIPNKMYDFLRLGIS